MHRIIGLFVFFVLVSYYVLAQNNDSLENLDITPVQALQVFGGSLDAVAFSADGTQLATGGRDNAVRLWDVATGENTAILAGHSDWVSSIAYSPDGTVVASGGRDHTIWLWDVKTLTSLRLIEDHHAEVKALTFTPDGQYLISGDLDGIIRIESTANPQNTQEFTNFGGGVWSMAMSPDGTTLAVGSNDATIWLLGLWDNLGVWITPLTGHHTPVTTVEWSSDGTKLISGEQNGHIRLWDVSDTRQDVSAITSTVLEGHLASVMGVNFTAHEGVAISTALDGTVRLWDIAGEIELASELTTIQRTGAPLTNLALSHDGSTSASVGTDGTLNIWSVDRTTINIIIDNQRPVVIVNTQPDSPQANELSSPLAFETNTPASVQSQSTPRPPSSAPTLLIPSIGIEIAITTFPLDGVSWAIDPWESLVGHLQGTAWLNGNGNMALGGHSVYPDGRAGIFNNLYDVNLGDEIIVQEGEVARRYIVNDIRVVPYTDISVVYPTAHNRVTLITCDIPSFQSESGLYGERLVVIADAVS